MVLAAIVAIPEWIFQWVHLRASKPFPSNWMVYGQNISFFRVLGVGASRVRDIFKQAKERIFLVVGEIAEPQSTKLGCFKLKPHFGMFEYLRKSPK